MRKGDDGEVEQESLSHGGPGTKLNLLLNHIEQYALLFLDSNGRITDCNPKTIGLFGYKAEEIKGKHISNLYTEEERKSGTPENDLRMAAEEGISESESWKVKKDGSYIWTKMVITPYENRDGRLEGFVVSFKECLKYGRTKEELQYIREKLATRIRIINSILKSFDLKERLELILDEILKLLNVEIGGVYLKIGNQIVLKSCKNISKETLRKISLYPVEKAPEWLKESVVIHQHNNENGDLYEFAKKEGIQAFASIPLFLPRRKQSEKEWLGAIIIASRRYSALPPEDIQTLQSMAQQIALAIEHSNIYLRAKQRMARLEALREIDMGIINRLSTPEILRIVIENVPKEFSADAIAISLYGRNKQKSKVFIMRLPNGTIIEEEVFSLADDLRHWLVNLQEPVIIFDLTKDPRVKIHSDLIKKYNLKSYMGIPLKTRKETLGILHLFTCKLKPFTAEDIDFFQTLAGQAAIALRSARLIEDLRESEERFRIMAASAQDAIVMLDKEGKVSFWNKAAERIFGYTENEVMGKNLHELFLSGEYLERARKEFRRFQNTGAGPLIGKLKELEITKKDGEKIPVEISISGMKIKGEWNSIAIIRDISQHKQAEKKLKNSLSKLRYTLKQIVYILGLTLEFRDPYTAGHQRRVSELSRAIAEEMGLTESQIEGISLAGLIHDIGKISVPSEILGKPVKLTKTEFALIKSHPQVAYDILKDVEFPWPIADAILQHHERMDGSGYPGALKGDQILTEAKILAVADVVEAMSSHRPYRPALGIEKALNEILENRGRLYDSEVVDACIRVFKEKNFKFSS